LVCGYHQELNFLDLKAGVKYEGGYHARHLMIGWFWEVLFDFNQEQKRKFLAFTTGSDRVPIKGLASVQIIIQRAGPDTDRLPTSATCSSILLLPEYSSKEKLRERMITAIENFEGFGLR